MLVCRGLGIDMNLSETIHQQDKVLTSVATTMQ